MKKTILLLTLLTLILTACGAASSSTGQADTVQQATAIADIVSATQTALAPVATQAVTTTNSATLNTDFTNAAPVEMQLLVGMFKLEGTAQAITSEQAKSLITLLTSIQGNTLSQDQITSTIQKVQAVLTADQINAIAQMQITQQTAMTIMQEQGLSMGGRGQGNGGQQPPQDGTVPQGTPPAMPDGQQQPPDGQGQPPAQPDGNGPQDQGAGMIPPPLLQALIQLLQTKVSS